MLKNVRSLLQREREQLLADRAEYTKQTEFLAVSLGAIDRELHAIDVYEEACDGPAQPNGKTKQRRGQRTRVLDAIRINGGAMSRGDILRHFGLHGDKAGEMSVSNALSALLKRGDIIRSEGKYHIA